MKEENGNIRNCRSNSIPFANISESPCFLKLYGLELCCLLYSIASSNNEIIVQNFYIDRICLVTKKHSLEECRNMSTASNKNDEKLLEATAAKFVMFQNLIETGFPIIISFFLGAWTDKHGSKPVFVVCLFGYFVASIFYIINSLLPDLSPIYILTSSVPIGLGGGLTALLLSGVSFVTRQTPIHERNFRMSLFSVCLDGGAPIGYFIGKRMYKAMGYTAVFTVTASLYGLAVICALFLISEKKPENVLLASTKNCSTKSIKEFFDLASVKDTIATCFKKRQNNKRRWILILITCITIQYFAYLVRTYLYLFTRNRFGWGVSDYSNLQIAMSFFNSAGGVIMTMVAIKLLGIMDINLGFVTILSNLSGYLIMILASAGWFMYLSAAVQMLGAITTAVMRSILSKCVEPDEQGKLFSFATCVEFMMPFVAGSVYGLIYMNTATTMPWVIFLIPIGIQSLIGLSYLYLRCNMRNSSPYSALRED